MPGPHLWSTTPRRYAAALACVAVAMAARKVLDPIMGAEFPYLLQFVAVLGCAHYLGFGPAVAGMALASLPPVYNGIKLGKPVQYWATLPVVCGVSVLLVWLLARQRHLGGQMASHREGEERYSAQLRAIVESSADAIISKNLEGVIESWNSGAEQLFGYTAEEAIGKSMTLVVPPDRTHEESDIIERIRHGGRVTHFETVRVRKDGRQIDVSLTISPIRDAQGNVVGVSHVARDISEQRKLEAQMRQAQKLESLGVLAGGLAHDFNNLLTGILGNASLVLEDVPENHPARGRVQEIIDAGERAAVLVRQMLAYAGKGRFVSQRLDLSRQISEILPLIRASLPPGVRLDLHLDPSLPMVDADPAQTQQVILNLAVNAAEAVGQAGGSVAITTGRREADSEMQVIVQVRDTGCGMDEATRARIFDPFFSTKFTGRGLGLAAVLGIIRAHRGSIDVESAPGRGSTFTVVLPACEGLELAEGVEQQALVRGYGTILVVDDEELVRNMARFTLERAGYAVETAPDGTSALEIFTARGHEFHAVLLDLTMPVLNGDETLQALKRIRDDIPVLLTSGFSENEALKHYADRGIAGFLQKPYTATTLTRKLKQALRKGSGRA